MKRRKWLGPTLSCLTLALAFIMFFPILWMFLTSFKTEADAFAYPPAIIFQPTLEHYEIALGASRYFDFLLNTILITAYSTLAALLLGVPAAYSLAYYPTKRTNYALMWIMSTRMLPAVGVIVPLYVIFKNLQLFDTYSGLVALYTAMNLPLVIWMMRSFLVDLPYEAIEAARIDGAGLWQELWLVILPMALPGLVSTMLLCLIFTWNEFVFSNLLTGRSVMPFTRAVTGAYAAVAIGADGSWVSVPNYPAVAALGVMTIVPIALLSFYLQKHITRGMSYGALP